MAEKPTSSKDQTTDRSTSEPEPESSSGSSSTQPRKRSPPFSRAELIFMVDFMENREYGVGERGSINSTKATILNDLRKALEEKFGVDHLERQIQKRYSDLRTREKETYNGIRNKIARDKGKVKNASRTSMEPEQNVSDNVAIEPPENLMEIPNGEELITLTFEPIPNDPVPEPLPDSNIVLEIPEQLVAMERRLTENMLQNFSTLHQKIDAMCGSLETRILSLEKAVVDLTQKSLLIDN